LSIELNPIDHSGLRARWEPPGNADIGGEVGAAGLTGATVEWDPNPGAKEVQVVVIGSDHSGSAIPIVPTTAVPQLSGYFRVSVLGETTHQIPADATASEFADSLQALRSIGSVSVSRQDLLAPQSGYSWTIQFDTNAGDIPQIVVDSSTLVSPTLYGSQSLLAAVFVESRAVQDGTDPPFDAGTVGVSVMPMGSSEIASVPAVHQIEVSGLSNDIWGSFRMQHRGRSSMPVAANASADELSAALEGMEGMEGAIVKKIVLSGSVGSPNFARYGVRYDITFASSAFMGLESQGAVPQLLVSTDGGESFGTSAFGVPSGSPAMGLWGEQFAVFTSVVHEGGLPSQVEIGGLQEGVAYYARIRMRNDAGESPAAITKFAGIPSKQVPDPPTNPVVHIVSQSSVVVQWDAPARNGGAAITAYLIQYGTDANFAGSTR